MKKTYSTPATDVMYVESAREISCLTSWNDGENNYPIIDGNPPDDEF